jgi:asparagine synthase (glutamine-hydrolysing)
MKGKETKYILKKLMEKYLPYDVIYREKTGFGTPIRKLVVNDLDDKINTYLSDEAILNRGIFDPHEVRSLINENRAGKIDASYTIWALLSIESWFRQFVDLSTSETCKIDQ